MIKLVDEFVNVLLFYVKISIKNIYSKVLYYPRLCIASKINDIMFAYDTDHIFNLTGIERI